MHVEGQNLIRGHNVSITCMDIWFHLTEQNTKHQPACMIQFDRHNWLNQLTKHMADWPHASDWPILRLLCLRRKSVHWYSRYNAVNIYIRNRFESMRVIVYKNLKSLSTLHYFLIQKNLKINIITTEVIYISVYIMSIMGGRILKNGFSLKKLTIIFPEWKIWYPDLYWYDCDSQDEKSDIQICIDMIVIPNMMSLISRFVLKLFLMKILLLGTRYIGTTTYIVGYR